MLTELNSSFKSGSELKFNIIISNKVLISYPSSALEIEFQQTP